MGLFVASKPSLKDVLQPATVKTPSIWHCVGNPGCGSHGTVPVALLAPDWGTTYPAVSANGFCPDCRSEWQVRPDFSGSGYGNRRRDK